MNDMVSAVAAGEMASAAILAALVRRLGDLGVLRPEDVVAIYDNALLMIETGQGASPGSQDVFEMARELIERHLRSSPEAPPESR